MRGSPSGAAYFQFPLQARVRTRAQHVLSFLNGAMTTMAIRVVNIIGIAMSL